MEKIKVSIIGATGYVGLELVRLLSTHPAVELVHLVSHSFAQRNISEVYPSLTGLADHTLEELDVDKISYDSDVVFTALPHAASAEIITGLYERGCRVIDMSADFRYNSAAVYEEWYKTPHANPELLKQAVYGLPELHRGEIRKTRLVGNPGCYTTCSILALAPLVRNGLIDVDSIIIDAKSGTSGAGRNPNTGNHFCEVNESLKAYNIAKHRHTSEIEQELSILAGRDLILSFTPHLLPINRGILATVYANLTTTDEDKIIAANKSAYDNEPFVRFTGTSVPEIKHVVGSNFCNIGYCIDRRLNRIVVVSVIDNLIKGAAGQAIQNMNLLFDLDERTGLNAPAWYL